MSKRYLFGGPPTDLSRLRSLSTEGPLLRAEVLGAASRVVGPNHRTYAELRFSGDLDRGRTGGEQRVLSGLLVTNGGTVPLGISVQEEGTANEFSATVDPGKTVSVPVMAFTQTWVATGPIGAFKGRWDGLNIRWKDPA